MNSLLLKVVLGVLVTSAAVRNDIRIIDWDELTGFVDGSAMPLGDNCDRVETTSVLAPAETGR